MVRGVDMLQSTLVANSHVAGPCTDGHALCTSRHSLDIHCLLIRHVLCAPPARLPGWLLYWRRRGRGQGPADRRRDQGVLVRRCTRHVPLFGSLHDAGLLRRAWLRRKTGGRRVLWVSTSNDLRFDARRDLKDMGAEADIPVYPTVSLQRSTRDSRL
jgi:hypothetical protein